MAPPEEGVRCVGCGTRFLPFWEGEACPGCDLPAEVRVPIVEAAMESYDGNRKRYGDPIPPVVEARSLWDDYVYRALFFLKGLDRRDPGDTEEEILKQHLDTLDQGLGKGWRVHLEAYHRAILRARHAGSEREK